MNPSIVSWRTLFFLLPLGYIAAFAPFGINDSDGGFLTGLAWQLKQGKTLYSDVAYVRPPLSVWMRYVSLSIFPVNGAVFYERALFYLQIALYSFLAADILAERQQRWHAACLGFVVSVHCYPAASWHTVDGILWAVWAFWLLFKAGGRAKPALYLLLGGITVVASALCKQSFYPLLLLWPVALCLRYPRKEWVYGFAGMMIATALFFGYLFRAALVTAYFHYTNGATGTDQALQHGLYDFFDINPYFLGFFAVLWLLYALLMPRKPKPELWLNGIVALGMLAIPATYAFAIWKNQTFTLPFAQSRLLFDVAMGWAIWQFWKGRLGRTGFLVWLSFLGISWCAAMSWGYNLPILFATPWICACREMLNRNFEQLMHWKGGKILYFVVVTAVFVSGYRFVYQEGPRDALQAHLGAIYPQLNGIYTTSGHAAEYQELRDLYARFGSKCKTLPSFTYASYLNGTKPPLPLDWVAERESGKNNPLVYNALDQKGLKFFVRKSSVERAKADPELKFTAMVLEKGNIIAETAHFLVLETSHE